MTNYDIRKDFPLLENTNIAYLDNSATTQRPNVVLQAMNDFYKNYNANVHRGAYGLSVKASEEYENSRVKVAKFIGARFTEEIIFTRNSTESINLIANSYGMENIKTSDKILLSIMEHHSNLVPWQNVAKEKGAILDYMYINKDGMLDEEEIETKIVPGVKIVGITHISNVLGTINPIKQIIEKAHSVGAIVIVDAAQSAPHIKINVQDLDADFLVFSGHKMLAPFGIGVLYGKKKLLENMKPFLYGGDMIEYVYEQETTFAELPNKFEAGTQNIAGAIGLGAAIDYLEKVGFEKISEIENSLLGYATNELKNLDFVDIYGPSSLENKIGVISFNVKGVHPHDTATILDSQNVCVRSGNHCAQPLLRSMGIDSTCRASIYFYNTKEDIDMLINAVYKTNEFFNRREGK